MINYYCFPQCLAIWNVTDYYWREPFGNWTVIMGGRVHEIVTSWFAIDLFFFLSIRGFGPPTKRRDSRQRKMKGNKSCFKVPEHEFLCVSHKNMKRYHFLHSILAFFMFKTVNLHINPWMPKMWFSAKISEPPPRDVSSWNDARMEERPMVSAVDWRPSNEKNPTVDGWNPNNHLGCIKPCISLLIMR